MRKSLRLLVATTAVAGSIATAAPPAQAWTCAINGEVVPEAVGDTACLVVMTAVGTACRVLPFPCLH